MLIVIVIYGIVISTRSTKFTYLSQKTAPVKYVHERKIFRHENLLGSNGLQLQASTDTKKFSLVSEDSKL